MGLCCPSKCGPAVISKYIQQDASSKMIEIFSNVHVSMKCLSKKKCIKICHDLTVSVLIINIILMNILDLESHRGKGVYENNNKVIGTSRMPAKCCVMGFIWNFVLTLPHKIGYTSVTVFAEGLDYRQKSHFNECHHNIQSYMFSQIFTLLEACNALLVWA